MSIKKFGLPLSLVSLLFSPAFAAKPINLAHLSPVYLNSFVTNGEIKELSRAVDFNKTQHVRIKQYYQGYPVWGADGVVHGGMQMNGRIYEGLQQDLPLPPQHLKKALLRKSLN